MESGSSCLCESSEPTDPTEYLEILKKKYLDRTAKLQAQQQDLERKIMKMETFIGKPQGSSQPVLETCQCDSLSVPKVFPETPVRDVPAVPRAITDVIQNQQPVTQQCSFFQKMMENAKSILSMKCQCPSTGAKATSGSPTSTDYAQTTATTVGSTDLTSSEIPTRENDHSAQENVVDYEETLTDKSSRTSTCTCEFTDPSTLQDFSCTCTIADGKTKVLPQSQQVSINLSSSTPQSQNTPHHSSGDPLTSTMSKSEKCAFKKSTSSDLISGECSCGECRCDSSFSNIDDKLNFSNVPIEENIVIPAVSVFLNKGDKPSAEVQVATPVTSKGFQMTKDTASKCVTCCKNSFCSSNKVAISKTGHLAAGVQVASSTKSRGVNSANLAKNSLNVGVTCCQMKSCPSNQPKSSCNAKCNTLPLRDNALSNGQDADIQACECNLNGLTQTGQGRQDGQNQCAFIGSPLLDYKDVKRNSGKVLCDCNTDQGAKEVCEISGYSLTSNDILEMQNIAELAKKEKAMKVQIEELQRREKQYQEATRNVEHLVTKAKTSCCSCHGKAGPPNINAEIDKISRELRLENQILKSELEDMKLELKHCLEKVEGPMKQKLETEKQKCECLQKDLQMASKNMLVNQDAYSREMNQLKMQLCCACTNITELNQMNQRLKDEMSQLDCLCQKLEDDLIKQKVNEAETIKRLTSRKKYGGESEEFKCDSNLDVIARKLSKTIKDLAPCEECSKLPAELAGAAKCIRDLTDMVRKRKTKSSTVSGCCCKAPLKPFPKKVKEEECCSCCGPTDGAGESLEKIKPVADKYVKTLHGVPQSFAQNDESSRFDVGGAQSSYYSAKGEPGREAPCATIGQPCFKSKSTLTKPMDDSGIDKKLPCSDIGEPCRNVEKLKLQDRLVQVPAGIDKGCRAPCSEMIETVKDPQAELALKGEKDSEEKPVQVPEEIPLVKEDDGIQAAIQDQPQEAGDIFAEEPPTMLASDSSDQQNFTEVTYGVVDEPPKSKFPTLEEGDTTESAPDISDGYLSSGPPTDVTSPEDESKPSDGTEEQDRLDDETEQPPEGGLQLRTLPEDILEVSEEISAEKYEETDGENDHGGVVIGQREIPFDEKRYGGDLPVDIENRAFGLDEAPADLHVTTTVTSSGTLEVITEGPGGTIGTTLTYTEEGNIEVVTEMTDNFEGQDPMLEKFATKPLSGIPFSSNDAIPCTPDATCETMEPVPGYEACDARMICHNLDNKEKEKLKAMPVASSIISGPSGPDAETPYTASTTTAEGELTSKLGSGSSGIRPQFDKTPDLTSSYGKPGVAMEEPLEELQELGEEHSGEPTVDPSAKASSREIGILSSGARAIGVDSTTGREGLPSEGTTSTAGELKSGEVFTPDQVASDLEEAFIASKSLQRAEIGAGLGMGAVDPTASDGPDERSAEIGGIATILKDESQAHVIEVGAEPKESEIAATNASGDFTDGEVAQLAPFIQQDSKPGERASEATPLPVTDSTGINWTRECACQSKDQTDQSCQCCECKTVGVTTSGDKETLTEKHEEMCKIPEEALDGAKTDTDSEFVTISETTDNAFAEVPSETKPEPQGTDEASSKRSSPFSANIISKEIVITSDLLKKYPQLANLSAASQQQALKELSIKESLKESIVIDQTMLEKHPELIGKSTEEQQNILKSMGYKPSTAIEQDIAIDEDKLAKHPELVGKSNSEQQRILQSLGYTPVLLIAVDDEILQQHPELADKSPEEQQSLLRELGYVTSSPSEAIPAEDDVQLLQINYETLQASTSKVAPSTDELVTEMSLNVPSEITEELLTQYPQLVGKTISDQQKILKDLGYSLPKKSLLQTLSVTKEMLDKHPELQGKTEEEQRRILSDLGYSATAVSSTLPKDQPIRVSKELLQKHPELEGKTSGEQQEILKTLGYKKQSEISIDKDLIEKHPELEGKSMAEQQQILKTLGYNVDELRPGLSGTTPAIIPGTDSATAKEELLLKHPELEGKSSTEQREMLKELGYPAAEAKPLAPMTVTEELLQKHPELLGKSVDEQASILKNLGYEVPAQKSELPLKMSPAILEAHPELAGKSVEEQKEMLAQIGYIIDEVIEKSQLQKPSAEAFESARDVLDEHKSDAPFSTPQPSSKDVSVTCKPPSQTAAVPSDIAKKSSAAIDKLSPEPSSKEVSITCRAPCRSAATIHSAAPKESEQNLAQIGDVSSASLTKSRSVSLQKKPSSRDDSASCKASCRAISVQSYGSKSARSSKDVKEIVAAKSDTTTTSSSSDARLKAKSKKDHQSKSKEHPGEVPSIVSQLSDKERPVPEPTSKKPRNHRKRRAKAIDCMKCVCPDPCKCAVCTSDKKKQSLNRPARSCDCPPNMFMVPPIMLMSPMQMTYSMPPTGHAANCRCNACICRDMLPKPEVDSKPEAESAPSEDREGVARQLGKHPSSCECVDCLCLPKVQKLARTKEYPIVNDTKQVYQVKVNCGTCQNAQNARRYVEQQQQLNRSRIPISTTSPNPPRVKSNPEQNIDGQEKGESSKPEVSGVSAAESTYNSIACDCAQCACSECPDESKRPTNQAKTNAGPKGGADCCCSDVPCPCQPCTVEELTKKLRDAEQKLADATLSGAPPPPGGTPLEKPPEEDSESCNCVECVCPGAASLPSKALPAGEGQSAETPKPESDDTAAVPAPAAAGAGDEECNCNVCACPGSTSLPPKSGADSKPVEMEVCDCQVCKCSPCADPQKKTDSGQPAGDQISGLADCDCVDCKCNPCADPKKQKSSQGESAAGKGDVEGETHGPSCDCPECACPAVDPKTGPITAKASKFTDMPEKIPHPPDCDCDECMCLEEIIQTELVDKLEKGVQPPVEKEVHSVNCTCIECICPECSTETIHGPTCKCIDCVCDPCDKKEGEGKVAAVKSAIPSGGEAGDHPAGCTCIVCKCDACSDPSKKSEVKATIGDQPHGDDCKCVECLCKECLIKLAPLKHEDGCQCAQCVCVECLKKMQEGDNATIAPKSAPEDVARGADTGNRGSNCTCAHCICIDCKGSGAPKSTSKMAVETKPSGHGDQCKCPECQCQPCVKTEKTDADGPCTCPVCTCVICSKKKEGVEGAPSKTGGPHGEQCTCTICKCKPCFGKAEVEEECTCKVCTCIVCTKKRTEKAAAGDDKETHSPACICDVCQCGPDTAAAGEGNVAAEAAPPLDPPPFEPFQRIDCNCQKCDCVICSQGSAQASGGGMVFRSMHPDDYVAPPFEPPMRIDCICSRCSCVFCNKEAPQQKSVAAQPSCNIATGAAMKKAVSVQQPAPMAGQQSTQIITGEESALHGPGCMCATCTCDPCKQDASKSTAAISKSGTGAKVEHPPGCTCHTCTCDPCKYAGAAESFVSAKGSKPALGGGKSEAGPIHCYCPTCTCAEGIIKNTMLDNPSAVATAAQSGNLPITRSAKGPPDGDPFLSADTLVLPKPDIKQMFPVHPADCDCAKCTCQPCADPKMAACGINIKESVKAMDNLALVKSIQAANKENCECKEQIEEIKRTLEKIKCACSEAEFRSTQSMAQTMGLDMVGAGPKPFVKQASVFGQTMSGLKMALNNLQLKCKAKDRMIEAMTCELSQRGSPEVFDKVLDESVKIAMALDYDQAEDVKSLDRAQLATSVLYGPTKVKDGSTAPCDLRCVASKGVEVRTHKHKKKREKAMEKKANDCECSNPQITQKAEKDCQKLDLSGFEVIDIRRITDDSLIVKWNAPKNEQVIGYDIFVNGSVATKVMSGARTSAMMHSLDLSKSVQITIYAITKCGRVEPPAIAIYEIKS